jgi:L-arabinose transport system substrate-binding protein
MMRSIRSGRRWRLVAATLVGGLVLVACGSDDTGGDAAVDGDAATDTGDTDGDTDGENGLLIAIYKSGTQEYFLEQAEGFVERAEELGFRAETYNVELDANLAISTVSDAIGQGADGIAITVPDQAGGPAIMEQVNAADIPLVATDDAFEDGDGNAVPFVGFDGPDMGRSVGMAAAELLQESGWLDDDSITFGVLSTEVQTLSVCMDRTDAAAEQVLDAGVTQDQIVPVAYDGTVDSALQAAGPVITANSDVTHWIVYACNDEGVLGTLNALENAGYDPENIIGVGLGAYEACRPWEAGLDTGFKAALYISGRDVGAAAAEALAANILDGTELPPFTVADTQIVDPDNYQDYMSCG